MAITDYTNLKTSIAAWLAKDNLTAYIPDFIVIAETRIYSELNTRGMETAISETISSGVVAVPSSYKQMKHLYVDGSPVKRIFRRGSDWVYEKYPTRSADAKPSFFAREGSNFIFGPYPDSDYTIKGIYYAKPDNLSDGSPTNWFTTNAPDLLLYGALIAAEPFLKDDERIAVWENEYQKAKSRVEKETRDEEVSGSDMRVTLG